MGGDKNRGDILVVARLMEVLQVEGVVPHLVSRGAVVGLGADLEFDDEEGLKAVAEELRRQGLVVERGQFGSSPRTGRGPSCWNEDGRIHGDEDCRSGR